MSATKFILTYRNGKQEEVITDADTCEAQSMRSFGLSLEEARQFGANVEFESEVNPPKEEEQAEQTEQTAEVPIINTDGNNVSSEGTAEQAASVVVVTGSDEGSVVDTTQDALVQPTEEPKSE